MTLLPGTTWLSRRFDPVSGETRPDTFAGYRQTKTGSTNTFNRPIRLVSNSDCCYKIWSRKRKVGRVSEKSITWEQTGRVRRAKNWRSEPRSLLGAALVTIFLRRGSKEH
jgi:hypothetical protein